MWAGSAGVGSTLRLRCLALARNDHFAHVIFAEKEFGRFIGSKKLFNLAIGVGVQDWVVPSMLHEHLVGFSEVVTTEVSARARRQRRSTGGMKHRQQVSTGRHDLI